MIIWYIIIAVGLTLNLLAFLVGGNKSWGEQRATVIIPLYIGCYSMVYRVRIIL